ncbi:MAG: metallophosphoesterase [Pseudomonadota bacterium]
MIKIVHISDIHIHDHQTNLSAISEGIQGLLFGKKPLQKGMDYLSAGIQAFSLLKRYGYSITRDQPEIRKMLLDEIEREDPHHVILSGDITNTALQRECESARRAFGRFVENAQLTIVPGNHDYPVFGEGSARIVDYFQSTFPGGRPHFPFVKIIENRVAIIGLNSCMSVRDFLSNPEVLMHTARGKVSSDQLLALPKVLSDPSLKGKYKIVVLHHHVLGNPREAPGTGRAYEFFMQKLINADELLKVLMDHGVDLVLHGHRHIRKFNKLHNMIVIGAGSAIYPFPKMQSPSFHVYEFNGESPTVTIKSLEGSRFITHGGKDRLTSPKNIQLWQYNWTTRR